MLNKVNDALEKYDKPLDWLGRRSANYYSCNYPYDIQTGRKGPQYEIYEKLQKDMGYHRGGHH